VVDAGGTDRTHLWRRGAWMKLGVLCRRRGLIILLGEGSEALLEILCLDPAVSLLRPAQSGNTQFALLADANPSEAYTGLLCPLSCLISNFFCVRQVLGQMKTASAIGRGRGRSNRGRGATKPRGGSNSLDSSKVPAKRQAKDKDKDGRASKKRKPAKNSGAGPSA